MKDNSVPKPDKYDGEVDWNTFKAFTHSLVVYFSLSGLPTQYHVYYLGYFLTKRARRFYNECIHGDEARYTLETALTKIFDLCFPPDFRSQQRVKFEHASMGTRWTVLQFARELQSLAVLLPDITERQLALRFFAGCHAYIQDKLSDAGYNAET
ncbi:hypothetical protein SISNIDRAFT_420976, partial [Sistotremastrum niveocremeum HHB9708]